MTTVNLWPQLNVTVYAENGSEVPENGISVTLTTYYLRLIRQGLLMTFDPREDPSGTPTPIPGTSGGGVPTYASAALLSASAGASSGAISITIGSTVAGDGGGGTWYWDPSDSTTPEDLAICCGSSSLGRWKRSFSGPVDVRWFGAKGNNDQTLHPFTYSSSIYSYTQQTADGIAIIKALRYAKSVGSGWVHIPRGTYRIYGYLEPLDLIATSRTYTDVKVTGDGMGCTILKNCDTSPVNTHGYGILRIGDGTNVVTNTRVNRVTVSDITLDGNGGSATRNITAGEWNSDNIVVSDFPNVTLERVESVNAVRDCVLVNFQGSPPYPTPSTPGVVEQGIRIDNCIFSNSWRNTLTIAAGKNIMVSNTRIARGGKVNNGTNPRACMDIETDIPSYPVDKLTFVNCVFEDGNNQLVSQVWSSAKFIGCDFNIMNPDNPSFRWAWIGTACEVEFDGCTFRDRVQRQGYVWTVPQSGFYATGTYAEGMGASFKGCNFDGVGYLGQSYNHRLESCTFINSKFPVLFEQSTAVIRNITCKNLSLINVVDTSNFGAGPMAGFAIKSTVTPNYIEVDGVDVQFDPSRVPSGVSFESSLDIAHGLHISPTLASTASCKISNVHVGGFWRKYPTLYGYTPSGFFTDWGNGSGGPVSAPADSASFAPGTAYYRNCTEYGNSP